MGGEYSLGVTVDSFDGPAPYAPGATQYPKNGHLALLRQFAHEVLSTAGHFRWVG